MLPLTPIITMKNKAILFTIIGIAIFGAGLGAAKAATVINDQVMSGAPLNFNPVMTLSDKTGLKSNVQVTSFDPIANVPAQVYIAHVAMPNQTIDVQRFIDPSTSVACYYSEIGTVLESVNCVEVPANSI